MDCKVFCMTKGESLVIGFSESEDFIIMKREKFWGVMFDMSVSESDSESVRLAFFWVAMLIELVHH